MQLQQNDDDLESVDDKDNFINYNEDITDMAMSSLATSATNETPSSGMLSYLASDGCDADHRENSPTIKERVNHAHGKKSIEQRAIVIFQTITSE